MITKLHLENFRSIPKADLPLGKITVLTGANNSGKSSLLYGFLVLRDFVFNPNRSLEQLFALPFINLGGFREVVSNGEDLSSIKIGIEAEVTEASTRARYGIELSESQTRINLSSQFPFEINAKLAVGLPYTAGTWRQFEAEQLEANKRFVFDWNGFDSKLREGKTLSPTEEQRFSMAAQLPIEVLQQADFVPIARTFSKPVHAAVPMSGQINTEDEVATLLRHTPETMADVRRYLEKIADRTLMYGSNGASGIIRLMTIDKASNKPPTALVNEGTGTNQLVTILAKIFQPNKNFTCIDEPEIHLHPSMVQKLAASFVEIAQEHGKQFFVSTHSEHFVQALMGQVAAGNIAPDDVKVYFLARENGQTTIEPQPINAKGQIKGGLQHFYAAELAGLDSFFKLVD